METGTVTAEEFRATWRSTLGLVTVTFLAVGAISLFYAAKAANGLSLFLVPLAGLFGALGWFLGRPLFSRKPVLRVDANGLMSATLTGDGIPWGDIDDLAPEVVQGHVNLVVTLAAGSASIKSSRGFTGNRGNERRIPLGGLPASQRPLAVAAALHAFALHGGDRARIAMEVREREAREQAAFVEGLATVTPRTWAMYLIVALNVAAWVLTVAAGVNPVKPLAADLFRWGGDSAWAVTRDHELWRLLTATFLHAGVVHLAFNMIGLWSAGRLLNQLQGNAQFLLVYFTSALAGSGLSLHFSAQHSVSVGASGAVFGVIGALLVTARKQRTRMPKMLGRRILTSEGVFAAYSLVQGFAQQNVDNAAHVGGLLAGSLVAVVLASKLERPQWRARTPRVAAALVLAAVMVTALVATTPPPPIDHRNSFEVERIVGAVWPRLQAAQQALESDTKAAQAGRMSEAELLSAVEKKHLPAMRAIASELSRLTLPASDPRAAVLKDLQQVPAIGAQLLDLQLRESKGEIDAAAANERTKVLGAQLREVSERMKARSAPQPKR